MDEHYSPSRSTIIDAEKKRRKQINKHQHVYDAFFAFGIAKADAARRHLVLEFTVFAQAYKLYTHMVYCFK